MGAWEELPEYFVLGLVCGLAAVWFTRAVYAIEDLGQRLLPSWWVRALVFGGIVGVVGACYPPHPPVVSQASADARLAGHQSLPPLFGVGYEVVDHALHLEFEPSVAADPTAPLPPEPPVVEQGRVASRVDLSSADLLREFWWLLPLVFLKPLLTSLTLAGGGSGGVFAPSLFIGATTGACFGLLCNRFIPGVSANSGVYAIVGMGGRGRRDDAGCIKRHLDRLRDDKRLPDHSTHRDCGRPRQRHRLLCGPREHLPQEAQPS